MAPEDLDIRQLTAYWKAEAQEALRVADHLLEKEDFSYALFFGHLAVEKMLKAVYIVRKKEHAPTTHNLVRLARAAGLSLDESKVQELVAITAFNIEARYPDLKRSFRKKCTAEFTQTQMDLVKEVFRWARRQLR